LLFNSPQNGRDLLRHLEMFPFDHQDDGIANMVDRSLKDSASRGRSGRLLMVGNNQAIERLTDIPRQRW
jgi:hypothetical protein